MAFDSLERFVGALKRAGELVEIDAPVDPYLEIAEITDRVVKAGGPALLFRDVAGSQYPVLTNQFGSERRMAIALDARSLDDVANRVRNAISLGFRSRSAENSRAWRPSGRSDSHVRDGRERSGPTSRRSRTRPAPLAGADDLAARRRPVHHPAAGHHQRPRKRNAKRRHVPMQVYDERTTGMHWQRHKQGRSHAAKWGRRIPVAVAIGADPALTYAATAPLPPIVDETAFAGFLRGRALRMTRGITVDLNVPADAEFVLEGYVDNDDLRVEDRSAITPACTVWPTAIRPST